MKNKSRLQWRCKVTRLGLSSAVGLTHAGGVSSAVGVSSGVGPSAALGVSAAVCQLGGPESKGVACKPCRYSKVRR